MDTERPDVRSISAFAKTSESVAGNRFLKALFAAAGVHALAAASLFAPGLRSREPYFVRLAPSAGVQIRSLGEAASNTRRAAPAKTPSRKTGSGIATPSVPPAKVHAARSGSESGGDNAVMVGGGSPEYPLISRRQGEEGEVRLFLHIGMDGRVTEATVDRSSGFARLDRAALDFFRAAQFRFIRPVLEPVQKKVSVLFRLKDVTTE